VEATLLLPLHCRHPTIITIRDLTARAGGGHLTCKRRHHDYDEQDVQVLVVLAMTHLNPQIINRQIARQTGIPANTARRILKQHKYHAYHITLRWTLRRIQQDPNFFYYVMFSDEAILTQNWLYESSQ
jgi:hypothetical protein